jgi:uncharacterized protein (TIGR02145 family)
MEDKNGPPDSVVVENLQKASSLKLLGTDTLLLIISTAINELTFQGLKLKVFPNPIVKNTTIEFYNQQRSNVTVAIFDITGRQIVSQSSNLPQGNIRYMLTGLQQGSYILNIKTTKGHISTLIMSSNKSAYNSPKLSLQGANYNTIETTNKSILKATKVTSDVKSMDFSSGDKLVLKAYFTGSTSVDTLTPTADMTIEFGNFYYTLTDYELNTYLAVEIGNQIWMAENLKVTHYPDGNSIPKATDDAVWKHVKDKSAEAAYCFYDNDKDSEYGVLYSWPAALGGKGVYSDTNPSGVQGVCPAGWHLPSIEEWSELRDFISQDVHFYKEGKALKATSGWADDGNGTDDYRFCALPGGQRGYMNWDTDQVVYYGSFIGKGNNATWWTSNYMAVDAAAFVRIIHNSKTIQFISDMRSNGFSIRCVKDLPANTEEDH